MNEILTSCISIFQTCKAFLPAMIKANHGHLVCISSAAGVIGINGLSGEYFTYYSVHGTQKLGLSKYKNSSCTQGKSLVHLALFLPAALLSIFLLKMAVVRGDILSLKIKNKKREECASWFISLLRLRKTEIISVFF